MTDTNKLKELAERALLFAPGEWFVENGMDQVRDADNDFVCETGEDEPIKAEYIAAANPTTILALIAEVERLRKHTEKAQGHALKMGNHALQGIEDAARLEGEVDRIKAENAALRQFAAEAYQVLGALDAPENVLDNASDAANGAPLRHETLLPFFAEGYEALRKDAERYRAIRQKDRGGVVVRDRTSHLFGESLDAAIDAALEGGGK